MALLVALEGTVDEPWLKLLHYLMTTSFSIYLLDNTMVKKIGGRTFVGRMSTAIEFNSNFD